MFILQTFLKLGGSRSLVALLMWIFASALAPKLAALGIDPVPFQEALKQALDALMVWIGVKGAADVATAIKTAKPWAGTDPAQPRLP